MTGKKVNITEIVARRAEAKAEKTLKDLNKFAKLDGRSVEHYSHKVTTLGLQLRALKLATQAAQRDNNGTLVSALHVSRKCLLARLRSANANLTAAKQGYRRSCREIADTKTRLLILQAGSTDDVTRLLATDGIKNV